jgi:hypothetical protein
VCDWELTGADRSASSLVPDPRIYGPERICASCGVQLPWSEFAVDRSKPSLHKSICRRCDAARVLARYHEGKKDSAGESLSCSECGAALEGRQRVTCGASACRDALEADEPDRVCAA